MEEASKLNQGPEGVDSNEVKHPAVLVHMWCHHLEGWKLPGRLGFSSWTRFPKPNTTGQEAVILANWETGAGGSPQ